MDERSNHYKLYSYDIYNTLIKRRVEKPTDIFGVVEQTMQFPCFREIRIEAERLARIHSRHCEVTIDEIYRFFQQMTAVSDEEMASLLKKEVEIEIDYSVLNKSIWSEIKKLISQEKRIILISDMYLGSDKIREVLKKNDNTLAYLPIYVSSDYRKTKQNGSLFKLIKEKEGVLYSEWIHKGDNYISDYIVPEWMGINARLIKNDDDCFIRNEDYNTIHISEKKPKSIEDIGEYYSGPVLFPYVKWILNICKITGIDRLYFLARDGYILKTIADIIIRNRGLEIYTKYVYASRKVWYAEDEETIEKKKCYVREEIDLRDNNYAFVDLQGTGKSLWILYNDMKEELPGMIHAFYYYYWKSDKDMELFRPYVFLGTQFEINIEVLCRAPHGPLIDYNLENGKTKPVLFECGDIWEKCGLNEYIYGITKCAESLAGADGYDLISYNDRTVSKCYMGLISNSDFPIVDGFLGDIPHDDNNTEHLFAPKISKLDIIRIFWLDQESEHSRFYKGENISLSIKRMSSIDKMLYHACIGKYGKSIKRMYRLFKNSNKKKKQQYKVILYTAGKRGKHFKEILDTYPNVSIIAWTDVDYMNVRNKALTLTPLNEAFVLSYDFVIIPMTEGGKTYKEIYHFLQCGNIDGDRIISGDKLLELLHRN